MRKAAEMILYRLGPKEIHLQNEEDDGENCKDSQANPSPFFHFFFNGFTLVLTEESFAGTAKCVDTRGVARLQQDKDNDCKCRKCHKHDHCDTKHAVRVI